jgi:serine/threonine protein kinase
MGVVYQADHLPTSRGVAIKFLKDEIDSPELRRRFSREAKSARDVRHPNVVQVLDVLELDDGRPAMVMEYLVGESLAEKVARDEVLPVPEVAAILLPVVSAVGTAHALGIVHRDLKPENIFLSRDGDDMTVKVLDFGIAKRTVTKELGPTSTKITESGALLGTPYYMPPEQVFGDKDLDHRADIWSLGLILYRCLSGLLPTEADHIGQVLKIVLTRPLWPLEQAAPSVPEDLAALVNRMLSRKREGRPDDLSEVRDVLARYADGDVPDFGKPKETVAVPTAASSDATLQLDIGKTFAGRYQVARAMHTSEFAAVYEVTHTDTGRRRALKVLRPSAVAGTGARGRFKRQVTLTADIESEHLVELFDAGVDESTNLPFVVMELLHGADLTTYIDKHERIPATETGVLASQAALTLDKAHAAGVFHRDLKPDNMFVTRRDDGSLRLKIMNFGVSDLIGKRDGGSAGRGLEPPLYSSPQQVDSGIIDHRTDLYALGHVVYAMLVGTAYWEDEAATARSVEALALRIRIGAQEPPSVRALRRGVRLRPAFDEWFARATAVPPEGRFQSGAELWRELAKALGLSGSRLSEFVEQTELVLVPIRKPADHGPGAGKGASDRAGENKTRRKPVTFAAPSEPPLGGSASPHRSDSQPRSKPAGLRAYARVGLSLGAGGLLLIAANEFFAPGRGRSRPPIALPSNTMERMPPDWLNFVPAASASSGDDVRPAPAPTASAPIAPKSVAYHPRVAEPRPPATASDPADQPYGATSSFPPPASPAPAATASATGGAVVLPVRPSSSASTQPKKGDPLGTRR